jgi:YNFM family putative membrane transporter
VALLICFSPSLILSYTVGIGLLAAPLVAAQFLLILAARLFWGVTEILTALPDADERQPEQPSSARPRPALGPLTSVAAVFLCGVCAFLDLYATQPLLPLFSRIFHAGKAAVGLTVSASTLGVALSAPLFGIFAERLSRKRVIVTSIAAVAVPTLLAATAPSLHALIFWRFMQGLLAPGIFAITIAYVTEEWDRGNVALVMSVYVSGTALGGFIGRILSGYSAEHFGWHSSFIVLGLLTLLGAVAVARWLPQERRPLPHRDRSHTLGSQLAPMFEHLRNPQLLATYAVGFNVLFSLVGVFTYITFYLADPPFRLSTAALSYLFVVYLVGLFVTPAAGYVITRVGLLRGIVTSIAISILGVAITLVPSLPFVIAGLALCSTGVFISQASATSYLREAAPEGGRVSAAGLYLCCYYVGGTAAGVVPSFFWRLGGWPACVGFIVAMQLATIGVAMVGWRARPIGTAQKHSI